MSTLSHKNSKKGLDVLEHQDVHIEQKEVKENAYKVHLNKIHDFSEVTVKPTELDPEAVLKPKSPQVSPYVKVEELVKEKPKGNSEFAGRMKEVLGYVRSLKDHKKVKVLEFDLSGFESEDDFEHVVKVVNRAFDHNLISAKEKADLLNLLRGFSLKEESVEESSVSLEAARGEYAKHYIDWEKKSRAAKKMFLKALSDLGVTKPVPHRLSQKSLELEEVMKEYTDARNKKASLLSAEEALEFFVKEKELLESEVNATREEIERNRIQKALSGWERLPSEPSVHRIILSNAILSDGANFSTVFSGIATATAGFTGLRVHREIKEEIKEPSVEVPMVNKEEKYVSVGKNFRSMEEPVSRPGAIVIDENALAQKEVKMRLSIENETSEKKKERLVRAGELIGIEYKPRTSPEPKSGIFGGFAKALGLNSLEAKGAVKEKKEEKKTPQLKAVMPLTAEKPKNEEIEVNITPSAPERGPNIPSAGHIPYLETFIVVVDTGIARKILMNSIEIATEVPFGNSKIFCLYDRFQEGNDYKTIRDAFNVALKEAVNLENVAKQSTILDFEGGKIYVFAGFPDDPNGIKVLLNGKEIAKGVYKSGPKVALLDAPGIKGGWLLSDTVYERAFKAAVPILKNIKIS